MITSRPKASSLTQSRPALATLPVPDQRGEPYHTSPRAFILLKLLQELCQNSATITSGMWPKNPRLLESNNSSGGYYWKEKLHVWTEGIAMSIPVPAWKAQELLLGEQYTHILLPVSVHTSVHICCQIPERSQCREGCQKKNTIT